MTGAYRIAVHESGHAIIAHELGARVLGLVARLPRGVCMHAETGKPLVEAAIALAGSIGESMFCGDCIGRVSDGDELVLSDALSKSSDPAATERAAEASARQILRRRKSTVLALADELERRVNLNGPEVRAIIDAPIPQTRVIVRRLLMRNA